MNVYLDNKVGTGIGMDEKGIYTALVLVHDDKGAALKNVSLLKERISHAYIEAKPASDLIYDTEIHSEEEVLSA